MLYFTFDRFRLCEFYDVHANLNYDKNIFYVRHTCMASLSCIFFEKYKILIMRRNFWHTSHLYGFSFVWILRRLLKYDFWKKSFDIHYTLMAFLLHKFFDVNTNLKPKKTFFLHTLNLHDFAFRVILLMSLQSCITSKLFDIHHTQKTATLCESFNVYFKLETWLNIFWHTLYLYGFFFAWIISWVCKCELWVYFFDMPHTYMDAPLGEFIKVHLNSNPG